MNKLEIAVQEEFSARAAAAAQSSTLPTRAGASLSSGRSRPEEDTPPTPFARVVEVTAGSPAAEAALESGDRVIKFGDVDWLNHDNLGKLAELVGQSEGVCLTCHLSSA
jgi:26S proteasome non-ATPase regulatory subunit 9